MKKVLPGASLQATLPTLGGWKKWRDSPENIWKCPSANEITHIDCKNKLIQCNLGVFAQGPEGLFFSAPTSLFKMPIIRELFATGHRWFSDSQSSDRSSHTLFYDELFGIEGHLNDHFGHLGFPYRAAPVGKSLAILWVVEYLKKMAFLV